MVIPDDEQCRNEEHYETAPKPMITCESCKPEVVEANQFIDWGDDARQCANVCQKHATEIWEATQPQIKAGVCWWSRSLPKSDEELKDWRGKKGG